MVKIYTPRPPVGVELERALSAPGIERPHMSCPFAKLGLPPSASQDDVKAAYRLLGT